VKVGRCRWTVAGFYNFFISSTGFFTAITRNHRDNSRLMDIVYVAGVLILLGLTLALVKGCSVLESKR